MRSLIVALIALPVAILLGPAAPIPKHLFPPEQFSFPTEVGAEWVYDDDSYKYTFAVTKVEEKPGAKLVTVNVYNSDKTVSQHSKTIEVSRAGLRETLNHDRPIDPPLPLLKLPAASGGKWESPFSIGGELRADYAFTSRGVEEVKVPAGTFRAIRVESTWTEVGGKSVGTSTTWYAPGAGPVRVAYRPGSTRDLVSFTPGKRTPPKK